MTALPPTNDDPFGVPPRPPRSPTLPPRPPSGEHPRVWIEGEAAGEFLSQWAGMRSDMGEILRVLNDGVVPRIGTLEEDARRDRQLASSSREQVDLQFRELRAQIAAIEAALGLPKPRAHAKKRPATKRTKRPTTRKKRP